MARHDQDTGDDIAAAILTLGLAVAVVVAVTVVSLIVGTCSELWRIYTTTGSAGTAAARTLWRALGVFTAVVAACVVAFLAVPSALPTILVIVGLSFLGFAVTVELADWQHQRHDVIDPAVLGDLDTYLEFSSSPSSPNDSQTELSRAKIPAAE